MKELQPRNNDVEMGNLLNTYANSTLMLTNNNKNIRNLTVTVEEITLTNDKVLAASRNLDTNKAHGPDGVRSFTLLTL